MNSLSKPRFIQKPHREGERNATSGTFVAAIARGLSAWIGLLINRFLAFRPLVHEQPGFLQNEMAPEPTKPTADAAISRIIPSPTLPERNSRKLGLLKRAGLFGQNTGGARIARAATLDDLRKAYRLVHDVYLGTGFIHPEPAGMRLRIFETTSDTATFIAKVGGQVVGVLSVVKDSPELGLPCDSAFKPELDLLRANKSKLCELTNQVVAEEYRKSAVPTELMRCAMAHIMEIGGDEAIATVSPSHNGFYELLSFRQIGSERSYSGKIHDPVIALSMNIGRYREPNTSDDGTERFMHRFLSEENHFLAFVGVWEQHARRQFLNAELLQQLFVTERNFITECTPEELRILHKRWGHELFAAVAGGLFLPSDKDSEFKQSTSTAESASESDFHEDTDRTDGHDSSESRIKKSVRSRSRKIRKFFQPHGRVARGQNAKSRL